MRHLFRPDPVSYFLLLHKDKLFCCRSLLPRAFLMRQVYRLRPVMELKVHFGDLYLNYIFCWFTDMFCDFSAFFFFLMGKSRFILPKRSLCTVYSMCLSMLKQKCKDKYKRKRKEVKNSILRIYRTK